MTQPAAPDAPRLEALVALPDGSAWSHRADGQGRLLSGDALRGEWRSPSRRWVWWSASSLAPLFAPPTSVLSPNQGSATSTAGSPRCWDLEAVAGLRTGRISRDPEEIWAVAHSQAARPRPVEGQLPLGGPAAEGPEGDVGDNRLLGPLRDHPSAPALPAEATTLAEAQLLAEAALATQRQQLRTREAGPGGLAVAALTDAAESAAALLAVQLERTGLPLDVPTAHALLAEHLGPPPSDDAERLRRRHDRDERVLTQLPARVAGPHDLRSPAVVRDLLAEVGVRVPDTRSWRLEAYQDAHPFVRALLSWRKAERLDSTYGYRWLAACVTDGRLRGRWGSFDGGAGRMTASSGLHNLPAELRPAIRAEPGHVLVRGDLGQVEPRVLAVVSRDPALRHACEDRDLYAPVAAALRCDRPRAKIAVLAAMYGQRSGTAGEALAQMERAYPQALGVLQEAEEVGQRGGSVRTYGGRLVGAAADAAGATDNAVPASAGQRSGRGRWLRNALVQGSAAELFKMWAVTVRAALADEAPAAEIVLCLHDELLVHVPETDAPATAAVLHAALNDVAAWWSPDFPVRFVAEVSTGAVWAKE